MIVLSFFSITFIFLNQLIFATSPSFVRQEIKDDADLDWTFYNIYKTFQDGNVIVSRNIIEQKSGTYAGDIHSVSYVSNGKYLNSTIWLTVPFNASKAIDYWNIPSYYAYIDVDMNNKTGLGGIDFIEALEWDHSSEKWKIRLYESTDRDVGLRIISEEEYPNNGENEYFVYLPLNLDAINNPSQYRVIYFARDNINWGDQTLSLFDVLNTITIPTPTFNLITNPVNIVLGKDLNNNKPVEFVIKSNNSFSSLHGYLPAITIQSNNQCMNKIKSSTVDGFIRVCSISNKTVISNDGTAIIRVNIEAINNPMEGTYTLPLYVNVSYPSELFLSDTNEVNKGDNVIQVFYLSVMVVGFWDQVKIWIDEFFTPFSNASTAMITIATAIIGGITAFRFWIRRKKTIDE